MAKVSQFVFFDFEMLCAENGMPFEKMEAIRLGAVKYDLNTEKTTFFDAYIKPQQRDPLTSFCKSLTHIEDKDLAIAPDFSTVLTQFLDWVGEGETKFFSWSSNDLSRLHLDASRNNIPKASFVKVSTNYVDFQKIFAKRVTKTNPSVVNALALYGLTFEGEMHNPMYDAFNTLRVYLEFNRDLVKTDLIMLDHYIFQNEISLFFTNINEAVKKIYKEDMYSLCNDLQQIVNIRTAAKLLKRTKKLVKKYENILYNRSKMFDDEIIMFVRLLVQFQIELSSCYNEHYAYGYKVIILPEYMMTPLQKIAS